MIKSTIFHIAFIFSIAVSSRSLVDAGDNHTCAVKSDGTLGCFGNDHKQAAVPKDFNTLKNL